MQKILFILLLGICSASTLTKPANKIPLEDLIGEWQFTYIEVFDWNEIGIPSDGLSSDYRWVISNNLLTERLIDTENGFIRTASLKYNANTNILHGAYLSQLNNHSQEDSSIIGFSYKAEIIRLDGDNLEMYLTFPSSINEEFALPGFGKCILKRIE